jgi:PhzF family phenazine biosynthesis protein
MEYKYHIVDVFTEEIFGGAQIAVFPNANGLDKTTMQMLARELNLSETVFVSESKDKNITRRLSVYSPTEEIDFAGPPIIASAHVLASIGEIELGDKYTDIIVEENIGPIEVNISQDGDKPELIQFKIKSQPIVDHYVPMEDQLASMLCLDESDIEKIKFQTMLVSDNKPYLIIPLRSFDAVRKAKFNYTAWSQLIAPICMAKDMFLFSKQSDIPASNFHARLVGPDIGVNEDPPIASAIPAFTGYLCEDENLAKGRHTFVIDRGTTMTRKSVLSIEMDNSETKENTIRVGGPAVMVGEGTINIPD